MIAMALSCMPQLLIADEPTTALDVTIQAQILKLFKDLQNEMKMSAIFVTHDLAVISEVADELIIMYMGKIVEQTYADEIFSNPLHPYTKGLLKSVPRLDHGTGERLSQIKGTVPDPFDKIMDCPFRPRCTESVKDRCKESIPPLVEVSKNHKVACYIAYD
jgi:oligopeptide/dipeptide ABC transporter ATP-binding protein